MKKICFRADANSRIGFGHFVRSLALADILKDDFDCVFYTAEPSDYQIRELRDVCPYVSLSEKTKFEDFLSYLDGSEIVVLDNYFYTTEYQKLIKEKGCKLVCIDDMHDKHYVADVVINHAYGCHKEDYSVEPYTQLCLGLNYALLREPFLSNCQSKKTAHHRLLICYGGADIYNLTCKTLRSLSDVIDDYQVEVVIGAAFGAKKELEEIAEKNKNIHIHTSLNAKEMSSLMQQSQIAFLSASSVLWEAIFSGCKIIYGYYVENQMDICSNVGNNSNLGLTYVGNLREISPLDLQKTFADVSNNQEVTTFVKPNVRSHYLSLFNSKVTVREACAGDAQLYYEWANDTVVRQMAFNTEPILWDNHLKWFNSKLKSNDSLLLLCYYEERPVGQVRFDINKEGMAEIDISIDKEQRGKGLGTEMLQASIAYAHNTKGYDTFISEVKVENIPSQRLFIATGFSQKEKTNGINRFIRIVNN